MEDCIFCKIVAGEVPALKIYEDETVFAFLDVKPIKPGHLLVIPKKHIEYLFSMDDAEYSDVWLKVKKLAALLKEKLHPKKVGIAVEGFGVPHAHIHLVPLDHGFELNPERAAEMPKEELEKIAEKLKA